jgi:hypothetical protein
MHHSGDQRRGNAKLCLECLGCLKIEVAVREAISQNALVMPGLDPGIHQSSQEFSKRWITGSSPVMTARCGVVGVCMTAL